MRSPRSKRARPGRPSVSPFASVSVASRKFSRACHFTSAIRPNPAASNAAAATATYACTPQDSVPEAI